MHETTGPTPAPTARRRARLAVTAALALLVPVAGALAADDDPAARARDLYARGEYEEARELLEPLAAGGRADGPLLYRLAYAQRAAGDPASGETQRRALELLEQEYADEKGDLETAFYYFSALKNVARLSEAKQVARRTLDRLASGDVGEPSGGESLFWVARLHDESDQDDDAATWYARAADAYEESGQRDHVYRTLSLRFLADRALQSGRPDEAASLYARLGAASELPVEDLDRLAETLAREGKYQAASDMWRTIERRRPGQSNRAGYMWRLASAAAYFGELPAGPEGSDMKWAAMTRDELHATLLELVQTVRQAQADWVNASAEEATPERREELEARIDATRQPFTAAALEYGLKRHGIREAAFFGGFSPMIFRLDPWELPERPAPEDEAEDEAEDESAVDDEGPPNS